MVEPAPRDTQMLRDCRFESYYRPPAGFLCHSRALTCLETESNLAPHMAASFLRHCNFSVCGHMRHPSDFKFFKMSCTVYAIFGTADIGFLESPASQRLR